MNFNYLYKETKELRPTLFVSASGISYYLKDSFTKPTLQVYSQEYELINQIELLDLLTEIQATAVRPLFKKPDVRHIFTADDETIVLSLRESIIVVIDTAGTLLKRHTIYDLKETETANGHLRCKFQPLSDERLGVIVESQFKGNLLAISKGANPSFLNDTFFETQYLNDTIKYPSETSISVKNLQNFGEKETIGLELIKIGKDYFANRSEDKLFVHHPDQTEIWAIQEFAPNVLVALVMTDNKSKSNFGNKNMPYYIMFIDLGTGEVIKKISPGDRSIYQGNMRTSFFKDVQGRLHLKTAASIYRIEKDMELKEIISLEERKFAKFRKFYITGQQGKVIHFSDESTGEIFNCEFDDFTGDAIVGMIKAYRKALKQAKIKP
ncbi:MAG: hypothetical protein ACRBG0_05450 [Lewinella sp.]|uniref:hypothetical protein n=1 Tax=Lewinella sp. TaxID=2004506 RepID=UPI003D6C15B7